MKKKILISICLILFFFISIVNVSAIEDTNQTLQTDNEIVSYSINEYEVTSDESNQTLSATENQYVLTSNTHYVNESVITSGDGSQEKPYKTILEAISASNSGDKIYIASGSYTGSGTNVALTIDKQLSIISYGNDEVILDGENNSWIWYITASNVVIDGITFKNGYANNGAAIYYEYGSTNNIINNSKFINNHASSCAGAVFYDSGQNSQILNTIFENNSAYSGGAILYWYDSYNNIISNCNFTGNDAFNDNGGAIYYYYGSSNCIFNNTRFENNTVFYKGGAIYYYWTTNNITFIDSNFINNTAQTGGALLFDNSMDNISFINLTFENNKANYGSALYSLNINSLNLINTIFVNNQALSTSLTPNVDKFNNMIFAIWEGGNNIMNAIFSSSLDNILLSNVTYWNVDGLVNTDDVKPIIGYFGQNITLEIYNSTSNELLFNETHITDENASVVFNYSNISKDCSLKYIIYHAEDNYYTSIESSDEFNPTIGDFEALQYLINQASENEVIELTRNYTYTIGIDTSSEIKINKNNLTIKGNAYIIDALLQSRIFHIECETFNLENITLTNAYSTASGGALYFTSAASNCNFNNIIFINNTVKGASNIGGGAIYISSASNNNFTKLTFINNTAKASSNSFGGAIYMPSASNNNFYELNFINNSAIYGGAIYSATFKDNNVYNSNFTNNKAIAVYLKVSSDNILNYSIFVNNGEALYYGSSNNDNLINLKFTANNVSKKGGAINFAGTVNNIKFINVTFENNVAGSYGAAIFFEKNVKTFEFVNATFENNKAGSDGGAIAFGEEIEVSGGYFRNVIFINNTARYGGAIAYCDDSEVSDVKILDTQFNNNSAKNGGAISYYGVTLINLDYINVSFINNVQNQSSGSTTGGGAVSYYGSTDSTNERIINSTFINNFASYGGGAIYYYSGSPSNYAIINTTFIDNYAKYYGGALYLGSMVNVQISNITCIKNNAGLGSAIYFIRQCNNNKISNSIFINNTGNTIHYYDVATSKDTIIDSVFINNDGIDIYASSSNIIANYNWFGNNANDYTTKPTVSSQITLDNWLFLNATVNPVTIKVSENADVEFVLEVYNLASESIINDNYTQLRQVNLNLSSIGCILDRNISHIGEDISLTGEIAGNASVTANFNSVFYTINLTISKQDSYININNSETTYGDEINLIANCTNAIGIKAKIYNENNEEIDANITIEDFKITIFDLYAGNYTLNITTICDNNYNPTTNSSSLIVKKANLTLFLSNSGNINPTQNETIVVELSKNDITGNLTYTINNATYLIENNTIILTNLDEGNYTVVVELINDTNYNYVSNYTSFSVNKVNYTIHINCENIYVGETAYVLIILPGDATGNVTVAFDNDTEIIQINETTVRGLNGILIMPVTYDNLTEGNYTVAVSYESDKYTLSNASNNFTVSKNENYTFDVSFENNIITIDLVDDMTGNITVEIGNYTYNSEIKNGSAIFNLNNLDMGNYTVSIYYTGNNKYVEKSVEINITLFSNVNLNAPPVVKYYKGIERLYAYLLDKNWQAISNQTITIKINGVSYNRITDETGGVSIALNLQKGEYDVIVSYNGSSIYNSNSINTTVTIMTTINSSDVIKVYKNGTQYFATFKDTEGNYLANGTAVTFNINGVFYTRYIEGNAGKAKLNINLYPGTYIITAINPNNTEMSSNTITVIAKIVENSDLIKYFRNDSQYIVRLLNDDGSYAGAGENVTFKINGVFYTRTTNSSGYAKLNINLDAGDYIITAEYGDCKVSNNITVLPILYADDLSMNYNDGSTFNAKLVDGQGNPLFNTDITFNINGVFYKRSTNISGIASLNINLMRGEYIITSIYNGYSISNTIKIF